MSWWQIHDHMHLEAARWSKEWTTLKGIFDHYPPLTFTINPFMSWHQVGTAAFSKVKLSNINCCGATKCRQWQASTQTQTISTINYTAQNNDRREQPTYACITKEKNHINNHFSLFLLGFRVAWSLFLTFKKALNPRPYTYSN